MIVYKSLRSKLVVLIIIVFNAFSPQTSFSQENAIEKKLEKLIVQIKSSGVDTFLILKSGCLGCDIIKKETSNAKINHPCIYIMTKKDLINSSLIQNLNIQVNFTTDTSWVFDFIFSNKIELSNKDGFYKNEIAKHKTHELPVPSHYYYDYLEIHSPKFNYQVRIINDKKDGFGFQSEKEKWFILSQEIIRRVEKQFQ